MSDCVTEIYRAGYNDGRKEHDYDPQFHEITFELQCYIEALEAALTEAHRVILHELDNGRTPYLLPVDNGKRVWDILRMCSRGLNDEIKGSSRAGKIGGLVTFHL